ncbi:MAG: DNA polymerase I [Pseudomonadota bacterium]
MDGSALAYRSHFAFSSNPLTNSRGMSTSAVYGFTMALLRILEKERPERIAVVFDSAEATFRHKQYKEYKATREKMPEELEDQLPYIQQVVEALRIPFLVLPTYEADDIIGTLATRAAAEGIETFMVTGDKDFLQIVGPKIKMYTLKKGGEPEVIGAEGAKAKWGIPPERVTDLMALMGDSSDNVPGVPGVGEKTATKLIQEFGSLDDLYRRLEEVQPEKLREKLRLHQDQARMCKDLVTLRLDAPIPVAVDGLKAVGPDIPRLRTLYQELDFHSLLEALPKSGPTPSPSAARDYERVVTKKGLEDLVRILQKAPLISVDTETTGLHPADAKAIGISFCTVPGQAFFVPFAKTDLTEEEIWKALRPFLEDAGKPKGGQNVKYDRQVFANSGIDVRGITFDTMIESYLLDSSARQHNLDTISLKYLGIQKIPTSELIGKGKKQIPMLEADPERLAEYACEDADMAFRLHELFAPQIEHHGLGSLYRDVELPLTEVLGDMEKTGIAVDSAKLKELSVMLSGRLAELTAAIHKEAGEEFNINSPKQLGPILFEKLRIHEGLGIKRVKKTQTGYATDQETLEAYAEHPIVALLLEYRNLSKLFSTYVESLPALVHPATHRIHTSFNQTVTATGRLSSSDPNLQNIPIRTDLGKEIRKAFIPGEKGWRILSADYSQIELRILAHLSDDPNLVETFRRKDDVHRRTASLIFGVPLDQVDSALRGRAKTINFGVLYGMGPQRLARETGIKLAEAKEFIEKYFEKYARVKRYLDSQIDQAREKGYVTTLLGRRREIPDISSPNPGLASNAERIALNTPIQGSAADLIKVAMVSIHRALKENNLKCRMLLQVHDELVFEVPEDEIEAARKLIRNGMESAMSLKVPIVVDVGVGANWAEAH